MSDLYLSHIRHWILRSPPAEWVIKNARELLIGTLRQGPIPKHVAFEMDGNRRFAKNHKIETIEGHNLGFEALARVLEICYKSGVKVVTVYAFSIENFNRPKHEVKGLMAMAKVKLEQLVQHGELLDRYGAKIRVLGERDLIPEDVLPHVDRAIEMTKHNNDAVLNICFPYTSRAEMTSAIKATVEEYTTPSQPTNGPFSQTRISQKIRSTQLKQGGNNNNNSNTINNNNNNTTNNNTSTSSTRSASPEPAEIKSDADESASSTTALDPDSPPLPTASIHLGSAPKYPNPETITAETIDNHTYTREDPPLDVFIRTSGVTRLSDFMLWQCHEDTHIFFLRCFWPEFDLWHFVPVLLEWQWRQKKKAEREGNSRRALKDRVD